MQASPIGYRQLSTCQLFSAPAQDSDCNDWQFVVLLWKEPEKSAKQWGGSTEGSIYIGSWLNAA